MMINRTSVEIRKNIFVETLGWYGVVATIVAYLLVSFLLLPPTSLIFQGLNLTGALGITVETYYKRDYQPFWLNLIWMLIALGAIVNVLIRR